MTRIITRPEAADAARKLGDAGINAALAKIFAARGITCVSELDTTFAALPSFDMLLNATAMAKQLADAIAARKSLLVIADYDADGATACAVAVRGLRLFGAQVDFIVPNRFEYGYGLTPEIVQLAKQRNPDILITVDNGIASVDGVSEANRLGLKVLITDHHLPGDTLPQAACIVNPNQPGCHFPSKNLAGVGVMFYVLLALSAELRERRCFAAAAQPSSLHLPAGGNPTSEKTAAGSVFAEPNLAQLLDLVALGTIADVVKLDQVNRTLVQQGLYRMRAGRACVGINALLQVAGKKPERVNSLDLGFTVGPRLNAAGRLDDMSLGIACLLSDNPSDSATIATRLDRLNRERRSIETDMQDSALLALDQLDPRAGFSLALFDESWHQGVIGILASRLKDKFHRPVIAFARANQGELKGSGRSIPGLHLRDALDLVSKRHPTLIRKFGGHAMAAGLSIAESDFDEFVAAFERVSGELLSENDLIHQLESDGALAQEQLTLEVALLLENQIWGQGFPAPQFDDHFDVENQRIVGEKHLKLKLALHGKSIDAILFNQNEPLPERIHAVYSLSVNEYNGSQSVQLILRHWQ